MSYGKPVDIFSDEFDRISKMLDGFCIAEIIEIRMDPTDFVTRVSTIKKPVIKEMFHGTKSVYVESILKNGLKSSFNRVSAYGKGTYFSPFAKTSLYGYTDRCKEDDLSYVFLCDIIVNDTKGNKSNIYVCPRDDSFRIKYLIRFFKIPTATTARKPSTKRKKKK
jgi:hypothetical protein